jgi:hypothetical protein
MCGAAPPSSAADTKYASIPRVGAGNVNKGMGFAVMVTKSALTATDRSFHAEAASPLAATLATPVTTPPGHPVAMLPPFSPYRMAHTDVASQVFFVTFSSPSQL